MQSVWSVLALAALGLALPGARAQDPPSAHGADEIPFWSLDLERRLQPWCANGCALEVPFTAAYRRGERTLVFVGVRHVFTAGNGTIRAIDAGFSETPPAILIAEGFPTAMGESPAPLAEQARRRGTAAEDQFSRGEALYAVSTAVARGIPFLGGEPTRAEETGAVERRGYTAEDIAFAYLVGGLSQSLRSGDLAGPADPKLAAACAQWGRACAEQYQLRPPSWAEVAARYRAMFGVAVTHDQALPTRSEPGTASAVARLNQQVAHVRDEHLLTTIETALSARKRVLVVFGGSHWTTLSSALEKRLGKPRITAFPD
jgi:hypothetical protein